jgi:tetratricopeptide (TPR) repeat protein
MTEKELLLLESGADRAASERRFADAAAILKNLVKQSPDNFDTWLKLSAMARAGGDFTGAREAVASALSLRPLDFVALMLKATILNAAGEYDAAGPAYGEALAQAPIQIPPAMAAAVAVAKERFGNWQAEQSQHLRQAVQKVTAVTPKLDRFITNTVHITDADRDGPTHFCYPELPAIAFHPRDHFPWMRQLELATDDILAEFLAAVKSEATELVPYISYPTDVPVRQWEVLNNNPDWTAIHLVKNGETIEANIRHCPQLMQLLKAIPQPDVENAGPNVMFSLLAPGAHIPPHTGVANTRLVCHLPLIVPEGCWFRVGDETRLWQRGEAWVFDDTIEHEALNPSQELRVILIFDVWHPALDASERAGVKEVISAVGGGGQRIVSAGTAIEMDKAEGFRQFESGEYRQAVAAYQRALKRNPGNLEVWNNLGNAFASLGEIDPAIEAFEKAIAIRPDLAVLYVNYAKALTPLDRDAERQALMRRAVKVAPEDPDILVELGLAEAAMQNFDAAETAYRKAIRLSSGFTPAYLEFGLMLENLNRIDALESMLSEARSNGIECGELDFLRAWVLRRQGQFTEAMPLAEATPESVSPVRRAQLIAELADQLGDTEKAFGAFVKMNEEAVAAFPVAATDQGYGEDVAEVQRLLLPDNVAKWTSLNVDLNPAPPTFIMGFPRSGTTLLDTMLMNVSNFHVLEELPVVRQIEYALGAQDRIGKIDSLEANRLRQLYFESLQLIAPCTPDKTVIDKHPLHMARIPIIHRIFPDAKIIFVERHPCDVVLSCFMANFQLNRAMRHFSKLADAAELYDKVFDAWFKAKAALPLNTHVVRYENLVSNLEVEMRGLLDFLEIDWNPLVLDNQKAAAGRQHIRTASYAQVTEPIYSRASGRWHRYRSQIAPILPILKPWADQMEYEI